MIETNQFLIRTIEEKDLDCIHSWSGSEFRGEYQEFQFDSKQALIKQFAEDGFCTETFQKLMICADDFPIGLLYINLPRMGLARLGLVLFSNQRGNGLGTQITKVIVEHLFDNYPIVRIEADTDIGNLPAQRVLEKAGFEREGILKKYRYHHGAYHDSTLYSITR